MQVSLETGCRRALQSVIFFFTECMGPLEEARKG